MMSKKPINPSPGRLQTRFIMCSKAPWTLLFAHHRDSLRYVNHLPSRRPLISQYACFQVDVKGLVKEIAKISNGLKGLKEGITDK